jgi:hypothetical protein
MENNKLDYGQILHSWVVPEYVVHDRPKTWYIASSIIAFILIIYCFFTSNFLFAVIIILASLIIIIHDGQKPSRVKVAITEEGIIIGRNFYDYDELKNFAVVDKSRYNVKGLYFEPKSAIKQRLSIPLENMDPNKIKTSLLKYLPLDKERTDIPVSEQLAKLLKL